MFTLELVSFDDRWSFIITRKGTNQFWNFSDQFHFSNQSDAAYFAGHMIGHLESLFDRLITHYKEID